MGRVTSAVPVRAPERLPLKPSAAPEHHDARAASRNPVPIRMHEPHALPDDAARPLLARHVAAHQELAQPHQPARLHRDGRALHPVAQSVAAGRAPGPRVGPGTGTTECSIG